jgi:hypothetical protein
MQPRLKHGPIAIKRFLEADVDVVMGDDLLS